VGQASLHVAWPFLALLETTMRGRIFGLLAGMALLPGLVGCHRAPPGPPLAEAYPVHGKITFPNKTPLKGGMITFRPKDPNSGVNGWIYEVSGLVDANGNYELGLLLDNPGAAPGEYRVMIEPRELEIPNSNSGKIPAKFSNGSIETVVKASDNIIDFVLQ
jgi:hypothetical protein